jgi:ABC-type transport system involved in Fe-S cluster assembly fused permease/ATPase subunit
MFLGTSLFPVNDIRPTNPDLFSRLHESRGKKTMVFSTHRFGNLTKYADIIVYALLRSQTGIAVDEFTLRYMNETAVVKTGTHEELMKSGCDYARMWKLQADAFT